MKIFVKTILIASLSTMITAVFADACTTTGYQNGDNYFGKTDCQKVVLSQLIVHGQLNINQVQVNNDAIIAGTVEGSNLSVKNSLTINGKTTLNKLKVAGSTTIQGQTRLSDTNLQNLKVRGKLNASGSQFANTTVDGSVNLHDVVVKGTLAVSTDLAILNGVDVQNIRVIKNSLLNKPQTICLEKASHVRGDVNFEAGNGVVYTTGASKIMGKVIGGKVIESACPNQSEVSIQ